MDDQIKLKKGTTTVGLVCKDGIVIGAEKRATIGSFIADKKAEKIVKITNNMVVTTAGGVSDAQLLTKLMKAELKLKQVRTGRESNLKEAANLLGGMVYANIRNFSAIPGITQFLLAGMDSQGFHLYDLFVDGSIMKIENYVSSGSGSIIAYGVLESAYQKNMTVKEGTDLLIKSINSAIQRDSGSGNGITVYTVTKNGVKKVFDKDLEAQIKA